MATRRAQSEAHGVDLWPFNTSESRLVTAQGVKEDHNNLSTISIRYFLFYLKAMSLGLIKHRTSKLHEKIWPYAFLTLVSDTGESGLHAPASLLQGKEAFGNMWEDG